MLVLAQNKKLRGVFTKLQRLWKVLTELEGDPCSLLVIKHPEGELHTEKGDFAVCAYGRVAGLLGKEGQVALHDADGYAPVYGIWSVPLDEVYYGAEERGDDGVIRVPVTKEGWEPPDD